MSTTPQSNSQAVIGRNDPCPCGSGKKYKKCCLQIDVLTKAGITSTGWKMNVAGTAAMPGASRGIHPYAPITMKEDPSPDLWSQLSESAVAELRDKWTDDKVACLETAEIVARLEMLGIDGCQATFVGLAGGRTSALSIGGVWFGALTTPPGTGVVEFIRLAACELWKRYCPEHPSAEMVDDWVTEGYQLFEANKETEAVDIWLRVWDHVRFKIEPWMTTYSAADAVFEISQFFGNWIQDLIMAIGNASINDEKYTEIGIRLIHEVLQQFGEESLNAVLNLRCDFGRLLCRADRREEGLATLQAIISEHPEQSCGYVELATELGRSKQADADIPRAIALLEQALAYPVIDAADWDLEFCLADLRDKMAGAP